MSDNDEPFGVPEPPDPEEERHYRAANPIAPIRRVKENEDEGEMTRSNNPIPPKPIPTDETATEDK
jgi:hypothetical protein